MKIQVLLEYARRLEQAHLATHSVFDFQNYLQSYIKFFNERLTLLRLISDVRLDFHGMRFLYVSSCESGAVKLEGADELQGLVWALMYAGSQAVMASPWPVDDLAAKHMARFFYRSLQKPGTSLMEAYREAMQQLRRVGSSYDNPYYWAPFVLFGDGCSLI